MPSYFYAGFVYVFLLVLLVYNHVKLLLETSVMFFVGFFFKFHYSYTAAAF